MSAVTRRFDLGAIIKADGLRRYEADVETLESLSTEQARERALKIVKELAYAEFAQAYTTDDMAERFERIWRFAFPAGTD